MNLELILEDLLNLPKSLLTCLKFYLSDEGMEKLESLKKIAQQPNIKKIVLIGHTYAYFASFTLFRYLNSKSNLKSGRDRDTPQKVCLNYELDEFISYFNPIQDAQDAIYIFISRKGNSIQIQEGIKKLLSSDISPENIWGISNDHESFLGRHTHQFLPLCYDSEQITGTKSYVNAILTLYFIGRSIMNKDPIPLAREEQIREMIIELKFYGQDWQNHTKNLTDFIGNDLQNLFLFHLVVVLA